MPYYKAPDNSIHFIDSEEFLPLLPAGVTEITKEEADVLAYVPPVVQPPEVPVVSEFQAKAAEYLLSTDWYVVRLAETGKAIPEEVLAGRAEARLVL